MTRTYKIGAAYDAVSGVWVAAILVYEDEDQGLMLATGETEVECLRKSLLLLDNFKAGILERIESLETEGGGV